MKFHYYPETDSLYIELSEQTSSYSKEESPGVVLDFAESGQLIGIDIDQASQHISLSRLEISALPLQSLAVIA